jgi:hypothetical protein
MKDSADNIRRIKSEAQFKPPKVKKPIAKKSAKKIKQEAEEKKGKKAPSADKERWFQERRREMTGKCKNCQKPSCKNSNEYFRFSVAHILAKRKGMFPSVATHPENWIELCQNCHQDLDNCMIDLTALACWDEVVVKFQKIYPSIAAEEKKRIPDILLQYINTDQ